MFLTRTRNVMRNLQLLRCTISLFTFSCPSVSHAHACSSKILLHLAFDVSLCLYEHKAFFFPTDHKSLWLFLCMHLNCAVTNISTARNRDSVPSFLLTIVILPVCKQTTLVIRETMRPGEEKKMGRKPRRRRKNRK